jgi:hypothetical protein
VRIIAGAFAIGVSISFWLLTFSIFIFLSLAMLKRYIEIVGSVNIFSENDKIRGYKISDMNLIGCMGIATGYISALVLSLYFYLNKNTQYIGMDIQLTWIVCPMFLYWISRLWLFAGRGIIKSDPVSFVIQDLTSWIIFVAGGVIFLVNAHHVI